MQASTPKERLWDDQAGRLAEFTTNGIRQLRIDLRETDTLVDQMKLDRFLVPAGHNAANDHEVELVASPVGDFTDQIVIANADGKINMRSVPWAGPVDYEFATPGDSNGFIFKVRPGALGANGKLGELWFTQTRQPTSGVAHEWDDLREPNIQRADTRAGNTYVVEHGEPRRVFTLEHQILSGADADLYDELLAAVGYGRHPFWYEHPDSGDASETIIELGSTAGWTPTNCTLATESGSDGVADGALAITSIASGAANIIRSLSGSEPTYFRKRVLHLDTLIKVSSAWLTDDAALQIALLTDATDAPQSGQGNFSLSAGLRGALGTGAWIRNHFDLEDGTSHAYEAGTGAGGRAANLGNVDQVRIFFQFTAAGQELKLDGFNLIRKDRMPQLVELLDYERTQDSPAPLAGPTFRVRLRMRQVLS